MAYLAQYPLKILYLRFFWFFQKIIDLNHDLNQWFKWLDLNPPTLQSRSQSGARFWKSVWARVEPGLKFDQLRNLVCKSGCQSLMFILVNISDQIKVIMIFWMIYFSEIFWKHSKDVSPLVTRNYKFFLGLSAWFTAYFFTEIRVGKFCDFFEKSKKLIFWIKIRFLYLNQFFFIFSKIFSIYTENWTNFNKNENLMTILQISYPYFQLCNLIFILVDLS